MDSNDEITKQIIGSAFTVSNQLGVGFLEKVYENALLLELRKNGLHVEQQKPLSVYYDDVVVGEYFADLFVQSSVIVELKVVKQLNANHQAQLINYLVASKLRFGLLVNFGRSRVEVKRMVNGFKK